MKSDVSGGGEHVFEVPRRLPVGLQGNLRLFDRHAAAHQAATHPQRFLFQVVDGDPGVDAALPAAGREQDVPDGGAGAHPGHPDAGDAIARHPADGDAADHPQRPRQQLASPVGRNREFPLRLHHAVKGQAAVLGDHQIARHVHQRCGVNGIAPRSVEVERGPGRLGGQIHEHQIGGDAGPHWRSARSSEPLPRWP